MTTTLTTDNRMPAGTDERARVSRHLALAAGLLYVTIVVFGLFAELGVRARLIEAGDPAATARNILADETLFRIGFGADLIVFLADVALAIVLFRLLAPINRTLAMLAAAFRMTQTAIIGLNLLSMSEALRILDDVEYLGSFGTEQVEALALLSLDSHKYGYILGLTFFGVATMIIGAMAVSSRHLPTPLGVVLLAAGAGYLADSAMFFLVPGYDGGASAVLLAPAVIGEAWFALWLLFRAHRLPAEAEQRPAR